MKKALIICSSFGLVVGALFLPVLSGVQDPAPSLCCIETAEWDCSFIPWRNDCDGSGGSGSTCFCIEYSCSPEYCGDDLH